MPLEPIRRSPMTMPTLMPSAWPRIDMTILPEPLTGVRVAEPLDLLIAEDDPHDQLLMVLAGSDAASPIRLSFCDDGPQLLAVLRRRVEEANTPDLVVLDIRMPGMDGHEVLARMQRSTELREVPVVVLSSSTARDDIVRCYARGALAYKVKPSRFDELVEFFDDLPDLLGQSRRAR
jgi:CheY-like chemotaxis protein